MKAIKYAKDNYPTATMISVWNDTGFHVWSGTPTAWTSEQHIKLKVK